MNKYIKKPIEVEALQIHGNVSEIKEFVGENGDIYIEDGEWKAGEGQPHTVVTIHTLEGDMQATDGDYIIKGVKGEFYPCRKDDALPSLHSDILVDGLYTHLTEVIEDVKG